jgi:hypothetical protein
VYLVVLHLFVSIKCFLGSSVVTELIKVSESDNTRAEEQKICLRINVFFRDKCVNMEQSKVNLNMSN